MFVSNEPSVTPSANVLGIKVHSGDLLVSRGGAEVSAFISRTLIAFHGSVIGAITAVTLTQI